MASSRVLQTVLRTVAPLVRALPVHGPPPSTSSSSRLAPVLLVGGTTYALNDSSDDQQQQQQQQKGMPRRRPRLFNRIEPVIPLSINLLVTNDVPVQPALLVQALPWAELDTEEAQVQLEMILQWKERGHMVDPATAVNICKKVSTWLLVKEIATADEVGGSVINTISEVLSQSESKIRTVDACRAKIRKLLQEDKVDHAYRCAVDQINMLDQTNAILESAREQIERASSGIWNTIMNHLKIAGGCVALYFALELIGTLPIGVGLDSLSCLQEIAMDGGLLLLSQTAALALTSPDYESYIEKVAQRQRHRMLAQQRLTSMVAQIMLEADHDPSARHY